jgi:sugar phosphate isomerase/epimerase
MSLPIALQLYSVRQDLDKDFEQVIKKVKEYGYDGVELASLHGKEPEYVKKLLSDTGLTPISAHIPLDSMLKNPDKVFSLYFDMGCKYVAVPYLPEERRPGKPLFDKTLEQMEQLGKKAKEAGLQLLYHNHDFEFVKIGDRLGLDVIYETVPAGLLQTQIDTCWVKVAGQDPAEYIRKYKGRAPVVHLKDFYKQETDKDILMYELIGIKGKDHKPSDKKAFGFMPLGFGQQDIPEILEASKEAGASWVVVEQDEPQEGRTALECARLSIKYLKNLIW